MGRTGSDILDNVTPVDFRQQPYDALFRRLQGNIVKGHGRDYTVNIFLSFTVEDAALKRALRWLARTFVTSAYKQLVEREQFAKFLIPGSLFGNLFLTPGAYVKLGHEAALPRWFPDSPLPGTEASPFLEGMFNLKDELGDAVARTGPEPLEAAYAERNIDAMLLLADDSQSYLMRTARTLMTRLETQRVARVVAVEIGEALRNEDDEGIEHFGFVDGRSQPLFLWSDFRAGEEAARSERVDDKGTRRQRGRIDIWDPFAPLSLALLRDPAVPDPLAFGSYYVFRKLEQDVLRFSIAEQQLADALKLEGSDRRRAGAMIVGRFRDGTPLALSPTDGFIPAKANNFRYDGLDSTFEPDENAPADPFGLRCPFQAHIRKVNPRQNVRVSDGNGDVKDLAARDRGRRIVRRGITYGTRKRDPNAFHSLEDLPTHGVGLLFACFQGSIRKQFLFMQRQWANNITFMTRGLNENQTGLDGIIGQRRTGKILPQHWRPEYGGEFDHAGLIRDLPLSESHRVSFSINGFVRFRGGEFFFAPSLTFLLGSEPGGDEPSRA